MTFWEFLDNRLQHVTSEGLAGAGIFVMTGIILTIMVLYPSLRSDDLFKVIAQAIVVQGLIGLAMARWFTKKGQ